MASSILSFYSHGINIFSLGTFAIAMVKRRIKEIE